jgi:hypothetical protein
MFRGYSSCNKLTGVGIYSAGGSEKCAFLFVPILLVILQQLG